MRIYVTGGTGFLGRHLIPALCREGHQLLVLTRYPEKHTWLCHYPGVEVIKGDLVTGEGLAAVTGCEAIIHAAGLFSMWSLAGDFEATNVSGTQHLLDAAVSANVKRIVYVSTIAVIGNPQPDQIIDEAHPPRPADPYQASKLRAEQVVRCFHDEGKIETVILRAGAFYGPLGDYAFNRLFFTDPMRGLTMQMDGGKYRIFPVYITDVVQAVMLALTQGRSGEIYNVCGDTIVHKTAFKIIRDMAGIWYPPLNIPGFLGIGFAHFLTTLSKVTRREPFYPLSLRSYVFNDWHASSEKARRELGFIPTSFEAGARRTLAWYQAGKPDWLPELDC